MTLELVGRPLGGPAHLVKFGELIGTPFVSVNDSPTTPNLAVLDAEPGGEAEPGGLVTRGLASKTAPSGLPLPDLGPRGLRDVT